MESSVQLVPSAPEETTALQDLWVCLDLRAPAECPSLEKLDVQDLRATPETQVYPDRRGLQDPRAPRDPSDWPESGGLQARMDKSGPGDLLDPWVLQDLPVSRATRGPRGPLETTAPPERQD